MKVIYIQLKVFLNSQKHTLIVIFSFIIGCVGFDGSCIKPGQTVDNDCNKYQCDRFSLCLQPVDMCNYLILFTRILYYIIV